MMKTNMKMLESKGNRSFSWSLIGFAATFLMASTMAADRVKLSEPQKFMDFRTPELTTARAEESFVAAINEHLEAFENSHPSIKQVTLTFTDVDRAGHVRYDVRGDHRELRLLDNFVQVRLNFDFQVIGKDGSVIDSGTKSLKKVFSITDIMMRRHSREAFFFEKELLQSWLEQLD